jgi:hypothetical protein
MNQKKVRRHNFGGGEYSTEFEFKRRARSYFLECLEARAEKAIDELDALIPLHERLFSITPAEQLSGSSRPWPGREEVFGVSAGAEPHNLPGHFYRSGSDEDRSRLVEALTHWAERWNLNATDGWIIEAALGKLGQIRSPERFVNVVWGESQPEDMDAPGLNEGWINPPTDIISMPIFWDTFRYSEADFIAEAETEFRRVLGEYREKVHTLMEEEGFIKTPAKQQLAHFDWLVLYLTRQPQDFARLAKTLSRGKKNVAESTVRIESTKLAKQLGLILPPRPRGRPRKTAPLR